MKREIYYDRQFRVWVGLTKDENGDQVGDCEYFGNRQQAEEWLKDENESY